MKKALNILKFILLILGVVALMPMLFVDINSVDMILDYTYVLFAIAVAAAIVRPLSISARATITLKSES